MLSDAKANLAVRQEELSFKNAELEKRDSELAVARTEATEAQLKADRLASELAAANGEAKKLQQGLEAKAREATDLGAAASSCRKELQTRIDELRQCIESKTGVMKTLDAVRKDAQMVVAEKEELFVALKQAQDESVGKTAKIRSLQLQLKLAQDSLAETRQTIEMTQAQMAEYRSEIDKGRSCADDKAVLEARVSTLQKILDFGPGQQMAAERARLQQEFTAKVAAIEQECEKRLARNLELAAAELNSLQLQLNLRINEVEELSSQKLHCEAELKALRGRQSGAGSPDIGPTMESDLREQIAELKKQVELWKSQAIPDLQGYGFEADDNFLDGATPLSLGTPFPESVSPTLADADRDFHARVAQSLALENCNQNLAQCNNEKEGLRQSVEEHLQAIENCEESIQQQVVKYKKVENQKDALLEKLQKSEKEWSDKLSRLERQLERQTESVNGLRVSLLEANERIADAGQAHDTAYQTDLLQKQNKELHRIVIELRLELEQAKADIENANSLVSTLQTQNNQLSLWIARLRENAARRETLQKNYSDSD